MDGLQALTMSGGHETLPPKVIESLRRELRGNLLLSGDQGYELARQLSQHPQLQTLRLIALTADSEHPGRELAREAGVERYLIKPVGSADLAELFT